MTESTHPSEDDQISPPSAPTQHSIVLVAGTQITLQQLQQIFSEITGKTETLSKYYDDRSYPKPLTVFSLYATTRPVANPPPPPPHKSPNSPYAPVVHPCISARRNSLTNPSSLHAIARFR